MAQPFPVVVTDGSGKALIISGATQGAFTAQPFPVVLCDANGNAQTLSNGIAAGVVASRVLLAQAAVDGSASSATLFTVPAGADGVYRISSGIVPRTLSSSAWVVNVDVTFPAGTHIPPQAAATGTINSGAISSPLIYPVYLHAADVVTCGTVTASGSNTGGAFDVAWTVERLV